MSAQMKKLLPILMVGLFIISCDKQEQNRSIFALENGELAKVSFMKQIPSANKIDFNSINSDLFNLVKTDFPEAKFLTLEINGGLKSSYIDLSSIKKITYTYSVNNEKDLIIIFIEDKVLYSLTKEKNKKLIGYIDDVDFNIYDIVERLIDTTYGVSNLKNIIIRQQTKTATSPEYTGGPLAVFYQDNDVEYVNEALACELISKKYFRIFRKTGDL
jgi:hypothetical protein